MERHFRLRDVSMSVSEFHRKSGECELEMISHREGSDFSHHLSGNGFAVSE
jgi:hypothetical protein